MKKMNNSKCLILRTNIEDYYFPLLKAYNFCESFDHNPSLVQRIIRKGLNFFKIPNDICLGKWKLQLKYYDTIVIFDQGYDPQITRYIKWRNCDSRIIVFLYNKQSDRFILNIKKDNNVDSIWTIDPVDSIRFSLNLSTTMYSKDIQSIGDVKIDRDIFFIGQPKDREGILNRVKTYCDENNLNADIRMISDRDQFISYKECIDLTCHSRCILDIVKEGQQAPTMRVMESLFLQKKLISNNEYLKRCDFYNPNNIFILGYDDLNDIRKFIFSPYVKLSNEMIQKYDFENWLKRLTA